MGHFGPGSVFSVFFLNRRALRGRGRSSGTPYFSLDNALGNILVGNLANCLSFSETVAPRQIGAFFGFVDVKVIQHGT